MKRSRLRRVSKSNSRPQEDLAFRREYMESHPYCEMTAWLRKRSPQTVPGLYPQETATDPHHLFGGAGRRVDHSLNLLAVCRPVHTWCHANLKDSRTLGIWLKVRAGLFDAVLFKEISGMFLEGWLATHEPSEPAIVPLWEELKSWSEGKA